MYDIIGDIHGYADHLEELLKKLGYENGSGYYKHPERKAIFVGDFIDRGPKIRETLSIVKRMVDENSAMAVMGNHEFNFLCYNTEISPGKYLRPHIDNNNKQVIETVNQFIWHENELEEYLNWFRELPLYLELDDIRIVHACWEDENIENLKLEGNIEFSKEFLIRLFSDKSSALYKAVDETLKGKEMIIPENGYFFDVEGKKRFKSRIKWWLDPAKSTYDLYYFDKIECQGENPVKLLKDTSINYYKENATPVFCGHYWLMGEPELQTKNVACVDYSVAKNNILSAYKWSGESELSNENFVFV